MHVLMFPGQHSQHRGMGGHLWAEHKALADRASEILGYSLAELCLDDPADQLRLTRFAQPAIYVANAFAFYEWRDAGGKADAFVGHSLGEYTALLAARCFDFEMGLRLVQKRGELMAEVPGGMAAVLGMTPDELRELLGSNGCDGIDLANLNSPTQVAIAGDCASLAMAEKIVVQRDARFIPLEISTPSHSRHMWSVERQFADFLTGFEFREPSVPVIAKA